MICQTVSSSFTDLFIDFSFLGIVSKKSNGHIGCLVHKIFNVSIFRPTEIPFEQWDGSSLDIGDEVTFQIDYMDLSSRLPFIRGVLN